MPDAMPDALTESFCERCGTRYEFAAPARITPIRRTRGLVAGLKNYIMSQDSLSDAVGDAMRSQADALAEKQLDAFHASFNFCIDCRQYTCTGCWNDAMGRCQSCQPLPEAIGMVERFETTLGEAQPALGIPFDVTPATPDPGVAWPEMDLTEPEPEPSMPLISWEEPVVVEPAVEPEPVLVAEVEPEPEPVLVEAEAEVEPEPEPVLVEAEAEVEPEPVVEPVPEPVLVEAEAEVEPEPEPVLVEAEAEPEPEPVLVEVEPEPEPEPEPVVEPEPEPYRPLGPISDTFLHFPRSAGETQRIAAAQAARAAQAAAAAQAAQAARAAQAANTTAEADVETLAARRAQLDLLGLGDPGEGPVGPARRTVIPYRSSGAAPRAAERQIAAAAGRAFWDASAREVSGATTEIGVRNCGHCELSISATARFCRRCGTPQAQSA